MPTGSMAAIATVLLSVLGTAAGSTLGWFWAGMLWAAAILCAFIPGFQQDRKRIALVKRSVRLIPELEHWLKEGETLEYRIRSDCAATCDKYIGELETWRRQVVVFLERAMPDSGASIRFTVADGDYGVGPLRYEMTRLRRQRANLASVLDQMEVYLRRSDLHN